MLKLITYKDIHETTHQFIFLHFLKELAILFQKFFNHFRVS